MPQRGRFVMATSKLQTYLHNLLYPYIASGWTLENFRPEWLEGLELDFWTDLIHTAIEVQGVQHYCYVQFFHGTYEGFLRQRERDNHKADLCRAAGLRLFYVHDEAEADRAAEYVKNSLHQRKIGRPAYEAKKFRRLTYQIREARSQKDWPRFISLQAELKQTIRERRLILSSKQAHVLSGYDNHVARLLDSST